ncbi:MAG: hypothetical protein D6680_08305 [Cyanobacteria bacterium J007]|nr:MAG: hypothetical protein D6680_08305 [Cyanobacteria bacterium J007]
MSANAGSIEKTILSVKHLHRAIGSVMVARRSSWELEEGDRGFSFLKVCPDCGDRSCIRGQNGMLWQDRDNWE